jgi:hypothetical protein
MFLWVSLFGGLALILSIAGLVLSMGRAERRARRKLYRSLGLEETTVDFLMARNRDVIAELTYVRHQGEAKIRREALPLDRDAALRRGLGIERTAAQRDTPGDADGPSVGGQRPPLDEHTRH